MQDSYKEHLTGLGLLRQRYETDMKTKEPVFDNYTGAQKVRGYDITPLGKLLLRHIGLPPEAEA